MNISFLRWCCNSEKQRNHPIGRTTETVIVRSVGAAMQPSARDLKIPSPRVFESRSSYHMLSGRITVGIVLPAQINLPVLCSGKMS